jgi:DNA-binding transcriptional regulator YdaS (Cro superfamily)
MIRMDTKSHAALANAIGKYPTLRAFSDAIDVPYQVVQQWRINGVPPQFCSRIEKLTGVLSEDLNDKIDWGYYRNSNRRRASRSR